LGGRALRGHQARRNLGLIGWWRLRYAEDRDDAVGSGDLDPSDQRLDEGLALGVATRCDDVGDVIGGSPQGGGWRRGGYCGDLAGQFVPVGAQLC